MLEKFKKEVSRVESETTVYVGNLEDKKAICVVPHKVINSEEFADLLNENTSIIQQNDIYTTYAIKSSMCFNLRLIYPAEEKHIKKYLGKYKFVTESYDEYLAKREKMESIAWVDNIIEGNSTEKIYYNDSEFVLIANYKWNGLKNESLQLLLIFKDKNLKTLRDIETTSVLIRAREVLKREIRRFNLSYNDIIAFFHYPPTYNQLHLHIENINNGASSATFVGRAKLLDDVINSISVDKKFYKRNLSFASKED